jgi:hypothetical protein
MGDLVMRESCTAAHDPLLLEKIMGAARQQKITTMGEFAQFSRAYLEAGYSREVSAACRQYFAQETTSEQNFRIRGKELRKWRQAITKSQAA